MALGRTARRFGAVHGRWPGRARAAIKRHAALPRSGPHTGRPPGTCLADGRTALSQHRRRSPGKRRAARRSGFLLPVTAMAVALITGITVAGYLMVRADQGGQAGAAFAAAALPGSRAMAVLEDEREQMIVMDTASHTMHVVGAPKLASRVSSTASSGSSSSGGGGGGGIPSGPPPNPGTAQSIAYHMMSSFGFSPSSQWTCLDDLWQRESGWNYQAENASGAYGIPQALPADKMASAGADYLTDPTTQIKWGLGYIQSVYGTPCGAWAHEEADGYY
jgi:Transglycosylase SLT domain